MSGDSFDVIIIVLNIEKDSMWNPQKDIHILNFIKGQGYEEASSNLSKKQRDHSRIGDEKFIIDISKYNYPNPREPFIVSYEPKNYSVNKGHLFGNVPVYITQDTVTGVLIGYLKLEYVWDGKEYVVRQINFIQ